MKGLLRPVAAISLAALLASLAGCASSTAIDPREARSILLNRSKPAPARVAAVAPVRARAVDSASLRDTTDLFKEIAWTPQEPVALRLEVLTSLVNDPDPGVVAEARGMGRLMLAREPSPEVAAYLSRAAADRNWTDYTPSLIRSWARPRPGVPDADRPERAALERLNPGIPVERVVFDAFVTPPPIEGEAPANWQDRFRSDAWDLLGRLDTDGSKRIDLVSGLSSASSPNDPTLDAIRAAVRDLRSMPLTGAELLWLTSLRNPAKTENAAWWSQASSAVARVRDPGALELRHAEAIRWASIHQPAWLEADRATLLAILRDTIQGREHHPRTADRTTTGSGTRVPELLREVEPSLRWGDVLAILVIDRAVRTPQAIRAFFDQAALDRRDDTTEYGGLLTRGTLGRRQSAPVAADDASFFPILFPPRPGQRRGDMTFIASDDMIAAGDRALAHYHFHVQSPRNREYAGPSEGDLIYAARMGRSCVVLTSINEDQLGIDYYQPDGTVVDLGAVDRP